MCGLVGCVCRDLEWRAALAEDNETVKPVVTTSAERTLVDAGVVRLSEAPLSPTAVAAVNRELAEKSTAPLPGSVSSPHNSGTTSPNHTTAAAATVTVV